MERMTQAMTQFGAISETAVTTMVLAVIGFLGTLATVGYKYKKDKPKPEDQSKVIFDQVNQFIKDQKQDRDDLRKELQEVKDELEQVRIENRLKDTQIHALSRELQQTKDKLSEVQEEAARVAATKIEEDKRNVV